MPFAGGFFCVAFDRTTLNASSECHCNGGNSAFFPSVPAGGLSRLIPVIQPSTSFAVGSVGFMFGLPGCHTAAANDPISSSMVQPDILTASTCEPSSLTIVTLSTESIPLPIGCAPNLLADFFAGTVFSTLISSATIIDLPLVLRCGNPSDVFAVPRFNVLTGTVAAAASSNSSGRTLQIPSYGFGRESFR